MAKSEGGASPVTIAKYLKGMDFPAKKKDLINHAKQNKAEESVLSELQKMPEHEYHTMADVMKEYGGKQ